MGLAVLVSLALVLALILAQVQGASTGAREGEERRRDDVTAASRRLLSSYRVRPEVQRELASMSATMTKRDVARHAAAHFPQRSLAEVNSIVAASAIAAGKPLPRNSATQAAEDRLRAHRTRQFEEAKKQLDHKKRQ